MLYDIKDEDIVIVPDEIKKKILKELATKKKILKVKFMNLAEFKKKYFGTYDVKAIYYLMKKYHFKYEVALEYLDNIYFIKSYYNELENKGLLIHDTLFKNSIHNICIINYDIDNYLDKELKKYNVRYLTKHIKNNKPIVYAFDKKEDEVAFVASNIVKDLEKIPIDSIGLIFDDEYKVEVKRVFDWFNIPINLSKHRNIYGTLTVNKFLNTLRKTKNISSALSCLEKNDIYNKIVDILNECLCDKVDDIYIEIIEGMIKDSNIPVDVFSHAINMINISFTQDFEKIYLLGFNQGVYPKTFHDDKLIKDIDRKKIGLDTSLERLDKEKKHIQYFINNTKNLIITYKLRDSFTTYYPSSLIEDFNLSVTYPKNKTFNYSNAYNKICLSMALDDYIKYGQKSPIIPLLFNSYSHMPYRSYDNSYKKINMDIEFDLSYTSMNNYYLCAFRFYVDNILKLGNFEENFSTLLGSLFHECLSKMYNKNFNLYKNYYNYIKNYDLTYQERFFINKLYKVLSQTIEVIKKQDSYSEFNNVMTEKKFTIKNIHNSDINFLGFVDKIKSFNNWTFVVDYKTGNANASLDNINYGLNMQLPIYIYLVNKVLNKKIAGFYLQKVLNAPKIDEKQNFAKDLRLNGFSINDENIVALIDKTYPCSEVIKGMSTTSKGFASYTKVLDKNDINKIIDLTQAKIDECVSSITKRNFQINPKKIDDELIGCRYCEFKDICFMSEKDIVHLKKTRFKDWRNSK